MKIFKFFIIFFFTISFNINAGPFTDEAIDFLIEKGFDPLFGARPLKRLLQDEVLNPLSEVILDVGDNIQDKIIFSKDKFGLIIANKNLKVLNS